MKSPHLLTLLLLFYYASTLAQTDSTTVFNVYKSLLQERLPPGLTADNGKHIVSINSRIGINTFSEKKFKQERIQASYSTQWRQHGFGAYLNNIPNDLLSVTTAGIQYAYGFTFKRSKLLSNTKIIAATDISITREYYDFSKLLFFDQIKRNQGFIYATSEAPATNKKVIYPTFNFNVLLRSKWLFANTMLLNINEHKNGLYQTEASQKDITFRLNSGIKFFDYRKFSGWGLYDMKNGSLDGLGLLIAYDNRYTLSNKMVSEDGAYEIRFSYFTPRIRAFAQYTDIPNALSGYLDLGTYSLGLALGITKQ